MIVEVDEYQHQRYSVDNEFRRMLQLFIDLGIPAIFLRFNPDSYTNMNGDHVGPVYSGRKNSELKLNEAEFRKRAEVLLAAMRQAITTKPTHDVTAIYLFYSHIPLYHTTHFNVPRGPDGKPFVPQDF